MKVIIPYPQKIRNITGSFGWVDHRLLRNGFLQTLCLQDIALYFFLVLVADKNGVSFYRIDKITHYLPLDTTDVLTARQRLIQKGLIAFKPFAPYDINGFYQLLPLNNLHPHLSLKKEVITNNKEPNSTKNSLYSSTRLLSKLNKIQQELFGKKAF